jgi:hypothetical protein
MCADRNHSTGAGFFLWLELDRLALERFDLVMAAADLSTNHCAGTRSALRLLLEEGKLRKD